MIGEKIAEETNKTTSRRILNVEGAPIIETSAQGIGSLCGVQYQSMVTYTGKMIGEMLISGDGQGVMMGKGGEMATFTAKGVGKLAQGGGVSWRGVFFIQSQHPKWSKLNSIASMFEYEVDGEGNGKGSLTEWK